MISDSFIIELRFDEDSVYSNFSTLPHFAQPGQAFVILDGKVLDISDYLDTATNVVKVAKGAHSRSFALERMFLPLDLTILFFVHMGEDITPYYQKEVAYADQYKDCLFTLFYHGVVNVDGDDEGCAHINLALWITMGCFLLYFLIKMNLANLSRLKFMRHFLFKSVPDSDTSPAKKQNNHLMIRRTLSTMSNHKYLPPYTLMFVPCFAESSEALRQTFDSLARASYPDTRKLLVFVCDGLVKSKTDSKDTYLCILHALGYSSTKDPELRSYISLGQGSRRVNYAKVYAGFYESGRNRVPFLMIVKVGAPNESLSATRAPGNRGKRDSMVIVLGFLERCMHLAHNRISPLEFELFNQCYNLLGIDPRELKYMLVTDADTQVQDDAVFRLVSRLEADPKILAITGHIRPANPEENIVTMLQIFPIYMTFYSGLAYEACLGSVSTINGGFVMYRLWTETSPGKNAFLYRHVTHSGGEDSPYSAESATAFFNSHTEEDIKSKRLQQPNSLQLSSKWPKVSDEIVMDDNKTGTHNVEAEDEDDDNSSSDDNVTTTTINTTVTASFRDNISYRRRLLKKKKRENTTLSLQQPTALSLAPNTGIEPCCIQPTVLRGFAAPRPDTMHMENVLLQGEEQLIGVVLLRSHPQYRIAFEPEAIAYATIPTNFFALQALQVRNLRAAFHNQIEFQHVAKHLGFMYWILSVTKLMDMVLSMPINVYLYIIFIRYFQYQDLAYATIVGAFTCLILLHMFYFMIRRQFKYILWFIIYGLFSVPIFNVYFPILACWTSDYANRWYDVWPTKSGGYHDRLHGIMMDEKVDDDHAEQEELEAEDAVVRMRLTDFEILEAEKTAQREKEQAEMLDAKFNGFTSFVGAADATIAGSGHTSKPSWSSSRMDSPTSLISSPPLAQIRDAGYASIKMKNGHSRFASEDDARFMLLTPSNNRSPTPRTSSMNSVSSNNPRNPFASELDDPFDDAYGELHHLPQHIHNKYTPSPSSAALIHHKPSRSQSSYFSGSLNATGSEYPYYPQDMFVPSTTDIDSTIVNSSTSPSHHRMRSYSTSSAIRHPYRPEDIQNDMILRDSDSVISMNPSLSNSVISLERDPPTVLEDVDTINMNQHYSPHHILSGNRHNRPSHYHQLNDNLSEGRNAPVHSRIATNQLQYK